LGATLKGQQFRISFYSPVFDPLKRRIFFLPVRWHGRALNEKWKRVEDQAMNALLRWVAPPGQNVPQAQGWRRLPATIGTIGLNLLLGSMRWYSTVVGHHRQISQRLLQALSGDRAAIRRIWWNIRRELSMLGGKLPTDSAPPIGPPAADKQ